MCKTLSCFKALVNEHVGFAKGAHHPIQNFIKGFLVDNMLIFNSLGLSSLCQRWLHSLQWFCECNFLGHSTCSWTVLCSCWTM